MSNRASLFRATSVTGALLAIYLATMPPTLTWAHHGTDGGDLVTAIAQARLPHPPGFPLYLLLGDVFFHLPWGDPAWRLNLMSAVLGAWAAGLVTVTADRELVPGDPRATVGTAAAVTGLTLGLAPLFWSQALIAEVYAPAALCTAVLLLLSLRRTSAWLLGGVWGVSLGVHPTLLWLAPIVVYGCRRSIWRSGLTALSAAVGCGVTYGVLLPLWARSASPWGDLSTFAGWWEYVSGHLYRDYVFALPPAYWPRRLLAFAGLLVRQFTPVGVPLAAWGWQRLWQERRFLALATVLAFGGLSLYAVGYNTADSLVYLVPALPIAALWLRAGLSDLVGRLAPRRLRGDAIRWLFPALCALPVIQAACGWQAMDVSGDTTAVLWARETLRGAPSNAVLLTDQDAATFTLWYVRDVLGERPDVGIVDQDLWGHEPYRRFLVDDLKTAGLPGSLEEALDALGRPIVEVRAPLEGRP